MVLGALGVHFVVDVVVVVGLNSGSLMVFASAAGQVLEVSSDLGDL